MLEIFKQTSAYTFAGKVKLFFMCSECGSATFY